MDQLTITIKRRRGYR